MFVETFVQTTTKIMHAKKKEGISLNNLNIHYPHILYTCMSGVIKNLLKMLIASNSPVNNSPT